MKHTKPRWRWQTRATRSMLKFASFRHGNKLQTSYRGNDLFKVMQQPSAPSGEWYWRILLENGLFSPPRTCLTPHSGWTPCDINVTCTSLKSAFDRWATIPSLTIRVCLHSFSCYCLRNTRNVTKFQENLTLQHCSSRSSILCQWKAHMWLPISPSYWSLVVTLAVSATVFKIFRLKDRKLLILPSLVWRPLRISGWN